MNDHALFIEDQKDFGAMRPELVKLALLEVWRLQWTELTMDELAEFVLFYQLGA